MKMSFTCYICKRNSSYRNFSLLHMQNLTTKCPKIFRSYYIYSSYSEPMHNISHTIPVAFTISVTLNSVFAYYLVQPAKDLSANWKLCVLLGRFPVTLWDSFSYNGTVAQWLIASCLIPLSAASLPFLQSFSFESPCVPPPLLSSP